MYDEKEDNVVVVVVAYSTKEYKVAGCRCMEIFHIYALCTLIVSGGAYVISVKPPDKKEEVKCQCKKKALT